MNFNVFTIDDFETSAKALKKRHKSLNDDLSELISSLEINPFQGSLLAPGIRKIRMAITSKGKGKSGGARVITFTVVFAQTAGRVYLIEIYDKSENDTVDVKVIQEKIEELGLDSISQNPNDNTNMAED